MNFAAIKKHDVANGPGVRVSLFVSGCEHYCKGCFNSEAWDFSYGSVFDENAESEIFAALGKPYIKGFSLLGGEPFHPKNRPALVLLLEKIKKTFPEKDVWCYTGSTLETDLQKDGGRNRCEVTDAFLSMIDVLVDGAFVEALKDITLRFRGSSNQRLIDMNKTRETGRVTLLDLG